MSVVSAPSYSTIHFDVPHANIDVERIAQLHSDFEQSAALIELLETTQNAPNLRQACFVFVNELRTHFDSQQVAIGLRRKAKGPCRLVAVSGVSHFDKAARSTRAIEAVLDEAILRNEVTVWPPIDEDQRHGALAHKNLYSASDLSCVVSTPLRDREGTAIGSLVVINNKESNSPTDVERFMRAAESPIASTLNVMQRLEGGRVMRLLRSCDRTWRSSKAKLTLAAILLLLFSMAVPLPYKIGCECQIEPVTRRFVAAPFEGTLEKTFVKPGDIVSAGDLLARMDGREIRVKRASVLADQGQAVKKRDSAMAKHNYADAQIARLEIERLDHELKLLEERETNIEIKSPINGIVTQGDLERSEGAPLTIGQSLFEIAPLEKMIVEIAVSDEDIGYVAAKQNVVVRLDAYPSEQWETPLMKTRPRSEIRDQDNVFIAEAAIDNAGDTLRPGMKGRAKVVTPDRSLGWILFHKPWEYLTKRLQW